MLLSPRRLAAAPVAAILVSLPALLGFLALVRPVAFAAPAPAACDVAGAGIEELIAKTPTLRAEANVQVVRDLRTLRDAAIVLETYKHPEECRQLVALVRRLAANPGQAVEASGDTDEEAAERVAESREPKAAEGKAAEGKGVDGKGEGRGGGAAKPRE